MYDATRHATTTIRDRWAARRGTGWGLGPGRGWESAPNRYFIACDGNAARGRVLIVRASRMVASSQSRPRTCTNDCTPLATARTATRWRWRQRRRRFVGSGDARGCRIALGGDGFVGYDMSWRALIVSLGAK